MTANPYHLDAPDDAEDWREQALCAQIDPEAFFPEKGGSSKAAKSICRQCPVQVECLEYALGSNQTFGVWGGLSARERHKLGRGELRNLNSCVNGHNPDEVGKRADGTCAQCRRDSQSRYKQRKATA